MRQRWAQWLRALVASNCVIARFASTAPESYTCARPHALGLESGEITNGQLSASSVYPTADCRLSHARLNGPSAWCSEDSNTPHEWIQIELSGAADPAVRVEAIATQGRTTALGPQFVRKYDLLHSLDRRHWHSYGSLDGGSEAERAITHALEPFLARAVRLVPLEYVGHVCLRLELYGCRTNGQAQRASVPANHSVRVSILSMQDGLAASITMRHGCAAQARAPLACSQLEEASQCLAEAARAAAMVEAAAVPPSRDLAVALRNLLPRGHHGARHFLDVSLCARAADRARLVSELGGWSGTLVHGAPHGDAASGGLDAPPSVPRFEQLTAGVELFRAVVHRRTPTPSSIFGDDKGTLLTPDLQHGPCWRLHRAHLDGPPAPDRVARADVIELKAGRGGRAQQVVWVRLDVSFHDLWGTVQSFDWDGFEVQLILLRRDDDGVALEQRAAPVPGSNAERGVDSLLLRHLYMLGFEHHSHPVADMCGLGRIDRVILQQYEVMPLHRP